MKQIDARGQACPLPVLLAKKELDSGAQALQVQVDNPAAVENLRRLAESQGLTVDVVPAEGGFLVTMGGSAEQHPEQSPVQKLPPRCGTLFFFNKNVVGQGDPVLGGNLAKMMLYTLSQAETVPGWVVFMNSGVQLPAGEEEQVLASLQALEERGCRILVCGTCLNFYGLSDRCKVGTVSNMYEILEQMAAADKVITV